jgi:hypothetical protein
MSSRVVQYTDGFSKEEPVVVSGGMCCHICKGEIMGEPLVAGDGSLVCEKSMCRFLVYHEPIVKEPAD